MLQFGAILVELSQPRVLERDIVIVVEAVDTEPCRRGQAGVD